MTDPTKEQNPANDVAVSEVPKGFIPMSAAQQRLQVPQRPGYHRHWFRTSPGRIARAQQAGYTFVDNKDVSVNNFDLGGDAKNSGNTDMGSHVSIASGQGEDGQAERLVLMECPEHLFQASIKAHQEINDKVAESIKSGSQNPGAQGETGSDHQKRYVGKSNMLGLFDKKS